MKHLFEYGRMLQQEPFSGCVYFVSALQKGDKSWTFPENFMEKTNLRHLLSNLIDEKIVQTAD